METLIPIVQSEFFLIIIVITIAAIVGGYYLYKFILHMQYPSTIIIAKVEGRSTDGRSILVSKLVIDVSERELEDKFSEIVMALREKGMD